MALKQFASKLLLSGKASLCSTPMMKQMPIPFSVKTFSSGSDSDYSNICTSSSTAEESPKVQAPAPHFEGLAVVGNDFKNIKLNDFSGKYLYLFFYPLDFTFVCPTEIIAFSDKMEEFDKLNTAVVGCSCDSQFSHLAWTQTPRKKGGLGELKYPLLADFKKTVARDYNVLLENEGVPLRGSFLIDPKGIIRQITVNDLPVGRSVDEVLRLVKAFQFVDTHGEVCPANWDPEKKSATIKPDPKGSKDYFEKAN